MLSIILSLLMLAGIALVAGGIAVWRRGDRRKAALMFVAALVAFGNVALVVAPLSNGRSPAEALR
jgi:hypothetical protein